MENIPENIVTDIPQKEIEGKVEKGKTFNSKKIKILASVVYGNLFIGSCYSLMAPIFPPEAEKKHASPTSYGLVFGIYQLTMFLASPVYGKLIPKLKPGFMMKIGMFVSGVSSILFGLLNKVPAGTAFIALAATIRCIDALGAAAFLTASYATLGCELPEIIGRAMSLTETAFALGLTGGPALGGVLYELGGFSLPFMVLGFLLLAGTIVNLILYSDNGKEIPPQSASALKLLASPDFLIDTLAICTCFAAITFNEASLEPHIRQFNVTPATTGMIFFLSGITDAILSPFWGFFAEKVSNCQCLTLMGTFSFMACFLIVGPTPFLGFKTNFAVVVFSQFLLGLGMAATIVCSFTHAMKNTVQRGFTEDVGTYSLISGVLFSAACFGGFIGPSLGGLLIDSVGYIHSTEVIVGMQIVVVITCSSRLIYLCTKKKYVKEYEVNKL